MKGVLKLLVILWAAGLFVAVHAVQAEVYIYPNKGQSASQQAKDQGDCSGRMSATVSDEEVGFIVFGATTKW